MNELTNMQTRLLELINMKNLTVKQMSEVLNIKHTSVRAQVSRLRKLGYIITSIPTKDGDIYVMDNKRQSHSDSAMLVSEKEVWRMVFDKQTLEKYVDESYQIKDGISLSEVRKATRLAWNKCGLNQSTDFYLRDDGQAEVRYNEQIDQQHEEVDVK